MLPVSLSNMSSNGDTIIARDDAWDSTGNNAISSGFSFAIHVPFSLLFDDDPTFKEITSYYYYNLSMSLQDEALCGSPLSDLSKECKCVGLSERYYEYSDFSYYKGR